MPNSFDIRSLDECAFADVLDEIAPGWRMWGCGEKGLFVGPVAPLSFSEEEIRADAEVRRKLTPIVEALRAGAVVLVDINGTAVPRQVWFDGRWGMYGDEERRVEWLQEVSGAAGRTAKRFSPHFRPPAAEQPAEDDGWAPPPGSKSQKVRATLERYGPILPGLGSDERKADFIRRKVGCSLTYAKQVMRDERKRK